MFVSAVIYWASQSHVDSAGASSTLFSTCNPTNTTTLFLLSLFIFLLLPMLASLSHPPTSVYHLRRIREQNNILRRIICRIKPINVSTDSFRLIHLISWTSVSCGNEWMLSNACQTHLNSLLAYGREEEVAWMLNSFSIDWQDCVMFVCFLGGFFYIHLIHCGVVKYQLTPASFLTDMTSCASVVVGFSDRMLRGQRGCSNSDHILRSCVFVCIPAHVCY